MSKAAELPMPTPCVRLHRHGRALAILLVALALYGCSSTPPRGGSATAPSFPNRDGAPINPPDVMSVPDAVPRVEPRSRYGNPSSYVVMGKTYRVLAHGLDYDERGGASWYGTKFHGQRTSSGEPYDMYAMTAAHRTLPIPSYARVTNLNNGKSVVVRINDRGPFHSERLIDLSYTAAIKLGIFGHGTGYVEVRAIDPYAALTATAAAAPSKPATPKRVLPAVTATTRDTEPAAARTARLFLQVGAFTSRRNADQLVARLQKAAFTSLRISPATHKNTTVYRVQVGPLASAAAAERMSERLTRFGIELPQVVAD